MLPVAYRELITASRKKSTFWLRTAVTAVGFVMCLMLLSANLSPTGDAGLMSFRLVTGLAFTYALLSGLWLTADCLSVERREGTLPLLYLTRLGRWELLLSKLAGSSLRGFYGLIAIFPVAAVPVMAGGVTAREQWQAPVVLLLTMIFSLSAGLLASAVCREEGKGQALTAALTLVPTATGFWGMLILFPLVLLHIQRRDAGAKGFLPWLFCVFGLLPLSAWAFRITEHVLVGSPAFAWYAVTNPTRYAFAVSIALMGAMVACYFCLAVLAVQWGPLRDESISESSAGAAMNRKGRKAGPVGDLPVEWLLKRTVSAPKLALIAAILSVLPSLTHFLGIPIVSVRGTIFFGWWGMIPSILLAFAVARRAAAGLAVMHQSGFIEVLLSTPIQLSRIILAQKRVFWRDMRWVLVLVIGSDLFPWIWSYATSMRGNPNGHLEMGFVFILSNVIQTVVYFAALLWLGMHFGYAKRKAGVAAGSTVLCVLVLPALATSLFSTVWMRIPNVGAPWFYYAMAVMSSLVSISIYLGLIRWARIKLLGKAKEEKPPRVLRGWLSPRMAAREPRDAA